jgi:hypothetical protein
MPRIFDNIEQTLLPALQQTLEVASHADFCVGYFNLRGWKQIDSYIEGWGGGEGNGCRLLVGGHYIPEAIVCRRFDRSLPNFFRFYQPLADTWAIFDNAGDTPKMIAFKEAGKLEILDPDLFDILLKWKREQ